MAKAGSLRDKKPTELISDYLNKKLNPQQVVRFEKWLKRDPEFAQQVRLQRNIQYALDNPDLENDIALLKQARRSEEKSSKVYLFLFDYNDSFDTYSYVFLFYCPCLNTPYKYQLTLSNSIYLKNNASVSTNTEAFIL